MSRINILALMAFVGFLVWVFLFPKGSIQPIQRGAMTLLEPAIEASGELESSVESFSGKLTRPELRTKLEEATLERDRLRLEVLRVDELYAENQALRQALNYVRNSPLQLVPARVINRKPATWYNTLIIDKGSAAGIVPDCPVIVPIEEQAGLVGKVSEVIGADASVIILVSDEMCQVAARIEGTTEQGILSGQRGALRVMPDLDLKYLSKSISVPEGRLVITSGAGGIFPENLFLGKIKSFTPGPITGEAKVEAGVNFDVLKNVFVVLPEGNEEEHPAKPPGGGESPKKAAP